MGVFKAQQTTWLDGKNASIVLIQETSASPFRIESHVIGPN